MNTLKCTFLSGNKTVFIHTTHTIYVYTHTHTYIYIYSRKIYNLFVRGLERGRKASLWYCDLILQYNGIDQNFKLKFILGPLFIVSKYFEK